MAARRKGPSGNGRSKRTTKRAVRKGAAKKATAKLAKKRPPARAATKKAAGKKPSAKKTAKKTARKSTPRKKTRTKKKAAKAPTTKKQARKKAIPKRTTRAKAKRAKKKPEPTAAPAVARRAASGARTPARTPRQRSERVKRFRVAASRAREIGRILHHYPTAGAATLELTGILRIGDWVAVRGHTTDIVERVASLRVDGRDVTDAAAGETVGIAFGARVRPGDRVDRLDP